MNKDHCICAAKRSPLCPVHAKEEEKSPTRVYVRYLGTRACITNRTGGFVMVDKEELSESQTKVCETGGGYVQLSEMVYAGLRWM